MYQYVRTLKYNFVEEHWQVKQTHMWALTFKMEHMNTCYDQTQVAQSNSTNRPNSKKK